MTKENNELSAPRLLAENESLKEQLKTESDYQALQRDEIAALKEQVRVLRDALEMGIEWTKKYCKVMGQSLCYIEPDSALDKMQSALKQTNKI